MDLVPIQPNPEYFRPDYTVADRVNWLIASLSVRIRHIISLANKLLLQSR